METTLQVLLNTGYTLVQDYLALQRTFVCRYLQQVHASWLATQKQRFRHLKLFAVSLAVDHTSAHICQPEFYCRA